MKKDVAKKLHNFLPQLFVFDVIILMITTPQKINIGCKSATAEILVFRTLFLEA